MNILELDQELRSNKIRAAYWLAGEERHLVLTAKKRILKTIFGDQEPMVDLFSARQTALAKILDTFKTPSLFAAWRCLVVEEADDFKKKEGEDLGIALSRPPEKAVLILISEKGPTAAVKKSLGVVCVVECKKLYPNQAVSWINIEAKDLNVPISREAAGFLVDCVGPDLGRLHQTLEMLALYVGKRKMIQLEDVEAVASRADQKSLFELANALGAKKPIVAVKCLGMILDRGEEPIKVLGLIARHLRLLALAQEIIGLGNAKTPPDFAQKLGVHPFFAKEYAVQSRQWNSQGWNKCFEKLLVCDAALKSSRHSPQATVEKLIWNLCRL